MSNQRYFIFIFSNFLVTKIIRITKYFSSYMRMVEMNFDLNKSMNISKKIICCNCFIIKLRFKKINNKSYINAYSFKLNLGILFAPVDLIKFLILTASIFDFNLSISSIWGNFSFKNSFKSLFILPSILEFVPKILETPIQILMNFWYDL